MLQCVSSYPAPDGALGGIVAIARATGLPVGYSDHTPGVETGAAAVRAGAVMLEKHLTYDTGARGPDHAASLTGEDFARYVALARAARPDGGVPTGEKRVLDCERDVRLVSRQSVVAARDLPAGHVIVRADVTVKRPGTGVPAAALTRVIGQRLVCDVAGDEPLPIGSVAV
jgi:N-acetylneuraminate synthase/N,N'-diacetyllegionaminate synthase